MLTLIQQLNCLKNFDLKFNIKSVNCSIIAWMTCTMTWLQMADGCVIWTPIPVPRMVSLFYNFIKLYIICYLSNSI